LKTFTSDVIAFVAVAAAAILGGCAGSPQAGSPTVELNRAANRMVRPNIVPYLYVSDLGTGPGNGVAQVFSYPNNTLAFTLTGFNTPAGECVDATGNVYITDTGASDIVEYANGGATPIRVLKDRGQKPVACAVRQSPYRVAVANGASGSISIYNGTITTTPNFIYSDLTKFTTVNFLGYYNGARLFLDGNGASGPFTFGRMTNGGTFFVIPVSGGPTSPGGVQQPPGRNYLAVGDASSNAIYHIRTNGVLPAPGPSNPNPTLLTGSCNSFGDFYIDLIAPGQRVVINPEPCLTPPRANEYKFPAGGPAGQQYTNPLLAPVGAVVSK
jgi:hypothetical protein